MGWIRGLTTEERTQFYQAADLGALFGPRERENITGVFLNMASLALYIGPHADDAGGASSVIPTEWTTPTDHFRDDLGTIVAFPLRLVDDPATFPAVARGWASVMDDLKRQMSPP